MRRNLEFKVRCESLDALDPRLANLNATPHKVMHQVDTYFHVPTLRHSAISETCERRLKLREITETGESWLIYYERPNEHSSRFSQYRLCEIAEPAVLKSTLAAALGIKTIVRKRRQVWMFNNTRIHLDTVESLGRFVELETVFQGQAEAEAVEEHQHVKTTLDLEMAEPIAGSYSDLILLP